MTEDAGLQWKRELLNQRRASLQEEARRAGPEPMPGIDWRAWHDRRAWREMMAEAIDEAEDRLERDTTYIIGAASSAGFGYSEGFDPETGATWRQSRDGGPAFAAAMRTGNVSESMGIPVKGERWRDKFTCGVMLTLVILLPFIVIALLLISYVINGLMTGITGG